VLGELGASWFRKIEIAPNHNPLFWVADLGLDHDIKSSHDVYVVDVGGPLGPEDAKRLIRAILERGEVVPSGHALEELEKDKLTMVDATNVLRGGVVDPPDFERGTWRYRVRTMRICIVVAFRSETKLAVVTGWREK
jgi:hypothetical protein